MDERLKEIRTRLRLSMNGVVSTSMREKGIVYKLNFGVSLSKIKEIAADFERDATFAKRLWNEDVRELKIIATLLYPHSEFSKEEAELWIKDVRYIEIAEQINTNLLQNLSYANELAASWITNEEEFTQVIGFLLYSRLFLNGYKENEQQATILLEVAKRILDKGVSRCQRAAILALKRFGRQNKANADAVLNFIADYKQSTSAEKQEFYDDLCFEFEYYN
jgi:Predicted DNA alkylation repair enzyme